MPEIRQLDKHLSELIAAGEVVERPASVVKELLENAIDAGATAVTVEMEGGGLTYLRISDNGCGIAPEQLPTAFLRHATSKLRTAEDLGAIGTLGFRGEALAAIAAVSHVDIFSRQAGAPEGASLHLDGGVPGEVTPAGCPEGTTICIRELFYNTPARMKFMKKDSAEGAAISGIVQHVALSHPEISFKLLRDGQEALHTPGDGQLLSAIYAAMGRDFAKSLLPISGSGDGVKVSGYITQPLAGHGTRGRQVFFVNGRFVKSQLLTAALEEAYRNQIMKGKFPGGVVHIDLPPQRVDVNVHPAKTVVKFVSDKQVFEALHYTAKDALEAEKKPAGKIAEHAPASSAKPFFQTMTARDYKAAAPAVPEGKKPLGSFVSRPAPPVIPAQPAAHVADVVPEPQKPFTAPTADPRRYYEIIPPEAVPAAPAVPPAPAVPHEVPREKAEPVQEVLSMPAVEQVAIEPVKEVPWRIAGEVLKTYIICEDDSENVWLIDKHAAHERIRFDALKQNAAPLMSQPLLTPLTVALEADDYAAVLENLPLLQEFAFCAEDFGGGTVLIREIPADIRIEDAQATMEELAHKLALGRADPAAARDELLHTMACKSAIKAGMTTSPEEMAALVEKVQRGEVQYCPHGRPVKYKLTKYELEKFFKRA